jgi:uncharacterized protein YkvS
MKKTKQTTETIDVDFSLIDLNEVNKYLPQHRMGRFYDFKVGLRGQIEKAAKNKAIIIPIGQIPDKEMVALRNAAHGVLEKFHRDWRLSYNPEKRTFLIMRRSEFDAVTKQEATHGIKATA